MLYLRCNLKILKDGYENLKPNKLKGNKQIWEH